MRVHIEQRRQFVRSVGRHFALQALQFLDHGVSPMAHTVDLAGDLVRFDEVVRNIDAAGTHQHGTPDGNAARHREAGYGKGHACTLLAARPALARQALFIRPRRICR